MNTGTARFLLTLALLSLINQTVGAKGEGKAVYFDDPDGHVLEIKAY